jgi:preprotein translocase subunit SecG
VIGALVGGKKGAAIGAAAGAGAGTAYVMSTRGEEVHLAKGTALTLKLAAPITVRVRS